MTHSEHTVQTARRVLALLDLTSLNDGDDAATVAALCARAHADYGKTAAVCVWPRFVPQAVAALAGTGVRVATVTNFPQGDADVTAAVRETADAVAAGADEVDVVFPYRAWAAGDHDSGPALVAACKQACGSEARLKVILETGVLADGALIASASDAAIAAGADFIKTSTGKVTVSATLEAARIMLEAIKRSGRPVGFKPAGGIRSVAVAGEYLALADTIMGSGWATPETFRFGASGVLDDVLDTLGYGDRAAAPSGGY